MPIDCRQGGREGPQGTQVAAGTLAKGPICVPRPLCKKGRKTEGPRIPKPGLGIGPWGLGTSAVPGIGPSDATLGLALPETRPGLGRARGRVSACPNRVAEAWEVGESLDILVAD